MLECKYTIIGKTLSRTGGINKGDKFNRLTAIEHIGETTGMRPVWLWLCDCGNYVYNIAGAVKYGNTKACGCWNIELIGQRNRKHGMRGTATYNTWCSIKSRCYNPKNSKYIYYGGRGIKMSDEWYNSFENFYADMGERPSGFDSIDRLDSDGDYTKNNCKWSTQLEQASNRRSNSYIYHAGKVYTLMNMSRKLGINSNKLDYLLRAGYELEEITYRIEHNISFKKGRPSTRTLIDRSDIYVPYDKIKEMGYAIEQ